MYFAFGLWSQELWKRYIKEGSKLIFEKVKLKFKEGATNQIKTWVIQLAYTMFSINVKAKLPNTRKHEHESNCNALLSMQETFLLDMLTSRDMQRKHKDIHHSSMADYSEPYHQVGKR